MKSYTVCCHSCRQIVQTRHLASTGCHVAVTHLNVGVKCPGSGVIAITDDDVREAARHDAFCRCERCADDDAQQYGPRFGEAQ